MPSRPPADDLAYSVTEIVRAQIFDVAAIRNGDEVGVLDREEQCKVR